MCRVSIETDQWTEHILLPLALAAENEHRPRGWLHRRPMTSPCERTSSDCSGAIGRSVLLLSAGPSSSLFYLSQPPIPLLSCLYAQCTHTTEDSSLSSPPSKSAFIEDSPWVSSSRDSAALPLPTRGRISRATRACSSILNMPSKHSKTTADSRPVIGVAHADRLSD